MFANINYLSIFVAAVAAWLFGAVYYTALSNPWQRAQGLDPETCRAEMATRSKLVMFGPFVLAFVGALIMAFVFYGVLVHLKTFNLRAGLISAAFLWFGFVLTTMTVNNAFSQRKAMLTVIDSLHWLGGMLIIGAIVGAWGQP
ncbi:MAG TPA: DUF1761 domain-containing protein [Xanthobacteraceae bacterium]|jgi:hypothetical protein|nr:DUF1761 domain-containing protein [Xanthobacteraceae bacterium]